MAPMMNMIASLVESLGLWKVWSLCFGGFAQVRKAWGQGIEDGITLSGEFEFILEAPWPNNFQAWGHLPFLYIGKYM